MRTSDRVMLARDEAAPCEPPIEHAVESICFIDVAGDRIGYRLWLFTENRTQISLSRVAISMAEVYSKSFVLK